MTGIVLAWRNVAGAGPLPEWLIGKFVNESDAGRGVNLIVKPHGRNSKWVLGVGVWAVRYLDDPRFDIVSYYPRWRWVRGFDDFYEEIEPGKFRRMDDGQASR